MGSPSGAWLRQRELLRPGVVATIAPMLFVLAGCHHHDTYPVAQTQTAPPIQSAPPRSSTYPYPNPAPSAPPVTPGEASTDDQAFIASHRPIYTEEGVASWYGPPYHNRQGANGKIFDQNAMTAAHRTLPMGSLIVVTNEKTGQSATMRVTDRGPFVQGRLLDLSMASAKATGVYLPGTATVRVDVYQTPHRWMQAAAGACRSAPLSMSTRRKAAR